MKNLEKQKTFGTCVIYNLANILRDKEILKYNKKKKFIPCGNAEINIILKELNYDFRIEGIISAFNWNSKIPKKFFKQTVFDFIGSNPLGIDSIYINAFILSVQAGSGEYGIHAIGLIYYNGKFAYTDPHNEEFKIIDSLDDLFDKYSYISSLSSFAQDKGFCAMNGALLDYIPFFNNN